MRLTVLRAQRFRNLDEVDLCLPAGLTVVAGANGQGKTSLLEAAFVLATGRSFRTRRLEELVARTGGPALVRGQVEGRRGAVGLSVGIDGAAKTLQVNGRDTELETFLGRLDVVDLTAGRVDVLHGGPADRRRFLDRGVVGLDPGSLRALAEYRHVLAQRNALLRSGLGGGTRAHLDAWDERLGAAGQVLHGFRRRYVERLAHEVDPIAAGLLPTGSRLELRYRASPAGSLDTETGFAELYMRRLNHLRERDRELGFTSEGPHRDDLGIGLDGIEIRRFGSAGQARAAMIALKLGKLSLIEKERGETPLFLMDDFDSDLDESRMQVLVAWLSGARCQVVVATSKQEMAGRITDAELGLRMEQGVARVA